MKLNITNDMNIDFVPDNSVKEVFPDQDDLIINNLDTDDTVELAQRIADNLSYEILNDVLIKPLDEVKVKRTIIEQDPTYSAYLPGASSSSGKKPKKAKKSEDDDLPEGMRRVQKEGIAAQQHGVIIKLPINLPESVKLKVGDVVVYEVRNSRPFELFKDSVLLPIFSVVGLYTGSIFNLKQS